MGKDSRIKYARTVRRRAGQIGMKPDEYAKLPPVYRKPITGREAKQRKCPDCGMMLPLIRIDKINGKYVQNPQYLYPNHMRERWAIGDTYARRIAAQRIGNGSIVWCSGSKLRLDNA